MDIIGYILGMLLVFCIGFKVGDRIYKTSFIRFVAALSFLALFYKFYFSFQFCLFAFFAYCLISVSVVDYLHRIIPVLFPIVLTITGVVFSFGNNFLGETHLYRFVNSLLGIFAGSGILIVIGFLGQLVYKKEVMGGGDVKLMAGVGAFIGWQRVLFAIFIAAVFAAIAGLLLIIIKKISRKDYIAFGPFLSLASFITIFLPNPSVFLNMFFIWETQVFNRFL
jgi:leader peptidase (prepilin peptidase)/N-methyltransferase